MNSQNRSNTASDAFDGESPLERKKRVARAYIQRGLVLLVIDPKKKKPINRWRKGTDGSNWTPEMGGDLSHYKATTNIALVEAMLDRWPNARLAVDGRASCLFLVDVDVKKGKDGPAALEKFKDLYMPEGESIPEHPIERSGSTLQSTHHFFRAPDGVNSYQSIGIGKDVIGDGLDIKWNGYVILPSGDGAREWIDANGESCDFEDLDFNPPQMAQWMVDGFDNLRKQKRKPNEQAADDGQSNNAPGRVTPAYLEQLLGHLDPEDFQGYRDYLELLMSCHAATNGTGRKEAEDFCARIPGYDTVEGRNETRQKWKSFSAGGNSNGRISERTLYKLVRDKIGHVPPPPYGEAFDEHFDEGRQTRQCIPNTSGAVRVEQTIDVRSLQPTDDPKIRELDAMASDTIDFVLRCIQCDITDQMIARALLTPGLKASKSILEAKTRDRRIARAKEAVAYGVDRGVICAGETRVEFAEWNRDNAKILSYGGKPRIFHPYRDSELGVETHEFQSINDFTQGRTHLQVFAYGGWRPFSGIWLSHPCVRVYERCVFKPAQHTPPNVLNLWQGFAFDPIQGNRHLRYLDHLRDNICDGDEEAFHYLIRWMAYGVQRPHEQGHVSIVMKGPKGIGKGVAAGGYLELFGRHGLHLANPTHLTGNFNAHLHGRTVVFLDEAFFAGDKKHEGILKALITEKILMITPKFVDSMEKANCISAIMASNSDWVFPATPDERRALILNVSDRRRKDFEYFGRIMDALKAGGYENLLHFLMNLDLSDFQVRDVPWTDGLREQVEQGLSTLQRWWLSVLESGRFEKSERAGPSCWEEGHITKDAAYRSFRTFLDDHGDRFDTNAKKIDEARVGVFLRDPKKIGVALTDRRPTLEGKRVRVWSLPTLLQAREAWESVYGTRDWETPDDEDQP